MCRRDGSWVVQEQGDGWNDFSSLKEAVKEKRDGGREGEEPTGIMKTLIWFKPDEVSYTMRA